MTDARLLFRQAPVSQPARLVFGEVEALPDIDALLDATLPELVVDVRLAPLVEASVDCELPALTVEVALSYDLAVSRPVVGQVLGRSQRASALVVGVQERMQAPIARLAGVTDHAAGAASVSARWRVRLDGEQVKAIVAVRTSNEKAVPVSLDLRTHHAELLRDRLRDLRTSSQGAAPATARVRTRSQDFFRDRFAALRTYSQGAVPRAWSASLTHRVALPTVRRHGSRHQQAMVPPAGVRAVVPPVRTPCYVPSGLLTFVDPAATSGFLLFRCDNHRPIGPVPVVVPVRRVYMVTNSVSVVRVSDGQPVKCDSAAIALEEESWAWGGTLALPASEFDLVAPTLAGPVQLLATLNGTSFLLLAERVSKERVYGSSSLQVQCRSGIAALDAPYAAVQSFGNSAPLTAQQLMASVLTDNGVPMGWDVDWGLDDWLVPAGVWTHQGTHIGALVAIAKAAGGYLRPHASEQSFKVLHRYPVAPWDWAGVTPDLVLPAAVTRRESKTWEMRPAYNRVFVAPQAQGLLGYEVTREGSAGDLVAPLVVESLVTAAAAVRQRARAELGQGGHQVTVGLGLPVLPETGIILPGTFVEYVDGADCVRGLVRSVSVESRLPTVWQSIGVETRA